MGELFLSGVFVIAAIVLIPCIIWFINHEKRFRQNCAQCNALIVGYDAESSGHVPKVIPEAEPRKIAYPCNSRRMTRKTCPPGTVIKVEYYVSRRGFWDVRAADPQYAPNKKIPLMIMCGLGAVFLTAAIVLLIIGLGSI